MLQQYFCFHFNINIPIFHSYGRYRKHHQALSLSVHICCSCPGHISDSHSNEYIHSYIHPTIYLNVLIYIKHLDKAFSQSSINLDHNNHSIYVNICQFLLSICSFINLCIYLPSYPNSELSIHSLIHPSVSSNSLLSLLLFISPNILVFTHPIPTSTHMSVSPSTHMFTHLSIQQVMHPTVQKYIYVCPSLYIFAH